MTFQAIIPLTKSYVVKNWNFAHRLEKIDQ